MYHACYHAQTHRYRQNPDVRRLEEWSAKREREESQALMLSDDDIGRFRRLQLSSKALTNNAGYPPRSLDNTRVDVQKFKARIPYDNKVSDYYGRCYTRRNHIDTARLSSSTTTTARLQSHLSGPLTSGHSIWAARGLITPMLRTQLLTIPIHINE